MLTAVLLLSGISIGCSLSPKNNPGKSTGTICISIDVNASRDLDSGDSTAASSLSNIYEILVYNEEQSISAVASPDSADTTVTVEQGEYTVLVLAGYGTESGCNLLGSGFREGVSVLADEITDVNIMLTSVTHQITVPSSATCMESYYVSVSGNTNSPILQISANGSTMENRPYIEIGDNSTNHYLSCTVDAGSWTGSIELTAPNEPETSEIRFYGSNIRLCDPDYDLDSDIADVGTVNWTWLNCATFGNCTSGEETRREIIFSEPDTGISVTVGWN